MVIKYDGIEYEVSCSLRVAYTIQSRFNHQSYMKIFQNIQDMKLEEQIRMLYIAFSLKNPDVCSEQAFLDYVLDNWNLNLTTRKVAELVENITFNGMSPEEIETQKKAAAIQR